MSRTFNTVEATSGVVLADHGPSRWRTAARWAVHAPGRAGATRTGLTSKRARIASIAAWAGQITLGLLMLGAGMAKLAGDVAMVAMFAEIGAGQWLRLLVGGCEVAGGVGLVIPRTRAWAALGLVVLLTGATITNLAVLQVSPISALTFGVLAGVVLSLRRRELSLR